MKEMGCFISVWIALTFMKCVHVLKRYTYQYGGLKYFQYGTSTS